MRRAIERVGGRWLSCLRTPEVHEGGATQLTRVAGALPLRRCVIRFEIARESEYGSPIRTGPSNKAAPGLTLRKMRICETTPKRMAIHTRTLTDANPLERPSRRRVRPTRSRPPAA